MPFPLLDNLIARSMSSPLVPYSPLTEEPCSVAFCWKCERSVDELLNILTNSVGRKQSSILATSSSQPPSIGRLAANLPASNHWAGGQPSYKDQAALTWQEKLQGKYPDSSAARKAADFCSEVP
jgi:hypothetical protein